MTTTRRQLRELGMEERFGELTEEIARVRAGLGYPIMVTPFPQMVIGQALANLLDGMLAGAPPAPARIGVDELLAMVS